MARGDIITPDVKKIISEVWHSHLKNGWADKEIQAEVAKRVQKEWPGKYKPDWPGLRAVQNKLVKIKEEYKNYQEYDNPWHLGLVAESKYNISPEAVPHILLVQDWAETKPDEFNQPHKPLTIGQAIWISRLHALIDINHLKPKHRPSAAYFLWGWATAYATREVICHISNVDFDSTELDKAFRVEFKNRGYVLWLLGVTPAT